MSTLSYSVPTLLRSRRPNFGENMAASSTPIHCCNKHQLMDDKTGAQLDDHEVRTYLEFAGERAYVSKDEMVGAPGRSQWGWHWVSSGVAVGVTISWVCWHFCVCDPCPVSWRTDLNWCFSSEAVLGCRSGVFPPSSRDACDAGPVAGRGGRGRLVGQRQLRRGFSVLMESRV